MVADPFRALYSALLNAESDGDDVPRLLAKSAANATIQETMCSVPWLKHPGPRLGHSDGELQASWALYALSRVSDYLLLSFQGRSDEPVPFPAIATATYLEFFGALGFRARREASFSPFFHEIVEVVVCDDPESGIQIEHEFWPGLMLGSLLFGRAGVRIRCHSSLVQKGHAESTLMCFAYRRHRRRAADRSLGWGSNSQWRTLFRRDYVDGDLFRFNVDGEVDIGGPEPRAIAGMKDFNDDLPIALRRELLVHRCFVSQPYPWDNAEDWPSRDTLVVRRNDPLVSP